MHYSLFGVNLPRRYYLSVCDPLISEIRTTIFIYVVALNDSMQHNGRAAMGAARWNVP